MEATHSIIAVKLLHRDVLWTHYTAPDLGHKLGAESYFPLEGRWQALTLLKQGELWVTVCCIDLRPRCSRGWMEPAVIRSIKPIKTIEGMNWPACFEQVLLHFP